MNTPYDQATEPTIACFLWTLGEDGQPEHCFATLLDENDAILVCRILNLSDNDVVLIKDQLRKED